MSFAGYIAEAISSQLDASERVLWAGQRRQGLTLRGSDAMMIPFSLVWGGFAFFWEWTAIHSNAPAFFVLWGIPFVTIGLYMIFGRFFYEAWQRSQTHYAVTNERILIVDGGFRTQVRTVALKSLEQ